MSGQERVDAEMEQPLSGIGNFWFELKRRKVMRVGITYGVVAWLLIQVSATVFPQFDIPPWASKFVTLLLMIGFPIALIIAWAYELSPDGIKTTKTVRIENPDAESDFAMQKRRNRFWVFFAAAVPTLIFGTLAIVMSLRTGTSVDESVGDEIEKSIAVLPFVNLSSDAENEYLSDGITEELLNALSKVPGLRVPARTSSFMFKGKTNDIKEIGKLLGVSTVLEGSVQKAGNELRVKANLINVADGFQLWSERYDRKMTNIFDIQDDIAHNIVSKLELELTDSKHHIGNVEAYTSYLKGKFIADKLTEPELRLAITYFEEALEQQPEYALAYTGLAFAYGNLGYFGYVPRESIDQPFREAVSKALELDDTLAEAQFSKAQLLYNFDWDWVGAEKAFKRALELDPANVWAHGLYAFLLATMGRHDEAMAEATKARDLDPLSVNANVNSGWMFFLAGDYQQALEAGRRGIAMDPNFSNAHVLVGYSLFREGEQDAGILAMEKAAQIDYFPQVNGDLGRMYGLADRKDDANDVLKNLLAREKVEYVPASSIASVYRGLGDFEKADLWMNKGIANREGTLILFRVDFEDQTHQNPYYAGWLNKIGLDKF